MQHRRIITSISIAAATLLLMVVVLRPLWSAPIHLPDEAKFQTAQNHIASAVDDLEAYIQANPNGKDIFTAKLQLKNLEALNTFAAQNSLVNLNGAIGWRVLTVDRQADGTHITLEIKNLIENEKHFFPAFDTHPLILIDDKGKHYSSTSMGKLPEGVSIVNGANGRGWQLQGEQATTMTIDFPPLPSDAIGGKILYKDDVGYVVKPIKFSY